MDDPLVKMDDPLDDAVAIQRALMKSASTDDISPKEWWTRATTALETAAAAADDWAAFVTKACKKLQIDTLVEESSVQLVELAETYSDAARFEQIRAFMQRDAIYVTAVHRAQKAKEKADRKKPQAEEIPF